MYIDELQAVWHCWSLLFKRGITGYKPGQKRRRQVHQGLSIICITLNLILSSPPFSECGAWTSNISITLDPARNAVLRALPIIQNSEGALHPVLTSPQVTLMHVQVWESLLWENGEPVKSLQLGRDRIPVKTNFNAHLCPLLHVDFAMYSRKWRGWPSMFCTQKKEPWSLLCKVLLSA